jgi:release factor glutamine methyltransferase
VLSNPPYIPTAVWKELEPLVREHEPKLALDGGNDGLAAIRAIAMNAAEALAPEGWLVLEHHHDHSSAVQQLLRDAGLERVSAYQDLEGNARFAVARRPAP